LFRDDLDELEVAILKKRLAYFVDRGVTGKPVFSLGEDFFELMRDRWTFDDVISTIHGCQEMEDRDDVVGETLPPRKRKRGRKSKKELAALSD
jgi:hypothetical protein